MSKKLFLAIQAAIFSIGCSGGFEKFAPPQNSISGRGAKVNPKILTTTPSAGSTVSPITGSNGTQIRVVFDMTMKTAMTPVINTWVRDLGNSNDIIWYSVANSGATFTWSSTTYANDTLTIQLGWVRWPENNIIGFDFKNETLVNLDDMPLDNSDKISFTVGWNPGRYKVVPTGQYSCYRYSTTTPVAWTLENTCKDSTTGGGGIIGTYNYPAGQNGFIDPRNDDYGPAIYGASFAGYVNGRRFKKANNPMNLVPANCQGLASDSCYPYSVDAVTNLVWKTCSQGQNYADQMYVGPGEKCTPPAGSDFTWGEAVNACSALNTAANGQGYGGRKDWRLPTIEELENLVDYGVRVKVGLGEPTPGYPEMPAIDGYDESTGPIVQWEGAFPVTPITKGYWTATGVSARVSGAQYYGQAYVVEFQKGSMGAGGGSGSLLESNRKTTNRKKVRCVAGPYVDPSAQSLTPTVVGNTATLGGSGATFWGYSATPNFHVSSAVPAYDIETNEHSLTVTFNKLPNSLQAGTTTNYCIAAYNATSCGASLLSIATAVQTSGNTSAYKLTFGSAMGANTAYKLFVSNVQSATDLWQTGQSYTVNSYVYDSGNVYRVAIAHTSSSIITDTGNGNLVLVPPFSAATLFPANTKLYVPGTQQVVNVVSTYTSSASAATDITNGSLAVQKTMILNPAQTLTLQHALFNGTPRTASPAGSTVFNVVSATSTNLTTVQVTFNRLPNTGDATTAANYRIFVAADNLSYGSGTQVASVTAATLSGYTATLTLGLPLPNLSANVAYGVVASNIRFAGANVVDDTVNKLRWQRCRKGTFDSATCGDDGDSTNDSDRWNDALNYCDSLNAIRYDDDSNTSTARYKWRAPTINELKSIANRSLFGTLGYAIDTTIFPTPNVMAEDYASSTNYTLNGDPQQDTNVNPNPPNFNQAWGFNFIAGFPSIAQKDNTTIIAGLKPPKKNIRCVRNLP